MRREPLTEISLDINAINGKLKLTQDKLLVLSIPYSTGWKAYVDGQETKTACANIMFLSLPVSAGEHDISLKYETPYLRAGACLTAAGFVMTILLIMFQSLLKRRDIKEE
ncbi:MAG: YfhO family protein [Lachnospiraceae bacterium]|nr:YfhO family protein [Lachnospiraceae bacterium]